MQHRLIPPALAVLTTTFVAAGLSAQAFAADPTGIWAKDDGSAKMEVTQCGRGICSKIVWLRDPNDTRGRPLRDGRNENVSMRERPIIGLPIFKLAPAASNVWVGSVYNPEEGRIYADVKVTLVSQRQLVLRGCKAMLFCGEKVWTRSQLPPSARTPAAEPNEIEVKAPAREERAATQSAAREPEAADEPAQTYIAPGVVATQAKTEPLPLSGENVSSMMVMTKPASGAGSQAPAGNEAAIEAASTDSGPPAPARAPREQAKQQVTTSEEATPSRVATREAASTRAANTAKPRIRQVEQEPQERLPWQRP